MSAECETQFAGDDPMFAGHFPENPLVPGVILTEALAQTAGIAAGQPASGRSYRLSAIKLMKFLKSVPPDTEVSFHAKKTAGVGGLLQFDVVAKTGEDIVA